MAGSRATVQSPAAHFGALTGAAIAAKMSGTEVAARMSEADIQARLSAAGAGTKLYGTHLAETAASIVPVARQYMPFPLYDVHRLGVVGDGDGAGNGTDDSAAIQACFDMILETGGTLIFDGTRKYRSDVGLTLLSSNSSPLPLCIDYNNCLFDFTNLTGSAIAMRYGATSLANSHAAQSATVGKLRMIGPEVNGYPLAYGSRLTDTTGVSLEYCLHWTLMPHQVFAFYRGWKTFWSWSNLHFNHHIRNNYIGLHLSDVSTYAVWNACNFLQNSVGVLFQGADTIASQNFLGCRFETNDVHVHMDSDPGNAGSTYPIRDILFQGGYYEAAAYDWFRIGMDYDPTAASSVRQATNTAGMVLNVKVSGGAWANNTLAPGSGTAAFCFDKDDLRNTRVVGFDFDGPISFAQRCRGRPTKFRWHATRNQQHDTDPLDGFDIGEGRAQVAMTSTSATAGMLVGNIASVTHVSNGVVDINFHDAYSNVLEYVITAMASADRVVTWDRVNSTVSKARLTVRDFAGAAAFADNIVIHVRGRQA